MKKSKKWKKVIGIVVMVVMFTGILAGCGEFSDRESGEIQQSEEAQTGESGNEVSVVETFEKTTVTDSYEEWIMHTYYKLSDGTWSVDIVDDETGEVETLSYLYRIVLHDRMPNAEVDSNYIILSNRDNITFEQAFMASGLSSKLSDYFTKDEAVFVSSWAGPLEANHPFRDANTIYVSGNE